MSTLGFDVLVHEVMAAISTSPEPSSRPSPVFTRRARSSGFLENPLLVAGALKRVVKVDFILPRSMRSWGRFGPAREVRTVSRSSSCTSV
jgi:hypothetical protein